MRKRYDAEKIREPMTRPQADMFLMADQGVPFPLFVAGYGAGKSETLVKNVARDVQAFPGVKVGVYAPTHDLLSLNLVPRLEEWFDKIGLRHGLNKSKHVMGVGSGQIIFRSMDNPSRIVAYEVYRSHVDEADLMITADKGEEAWNRIIGRNRQKHPDEDEHFNMVSAYSTPEGFKFTYNRWQKSPGVGYQFVRAPTSSNPFLPESFIENLLNTYTPEQCKAYLEGIWTNIFTGTVYSYFDRDKHHTNRIVTPKDKLLIGCDFNYGGSCGAIYVNKTEADQLRRDHELMRRFKAECKEKSRDFNRAMKRAERETVGLDLVDEFAAQDTMDMVDVINDRYEDHSVFMFPDSTGKRNTTNASRSDIAMLQQAGFTIKARPSNPRIVDRLNSVQRLIYNGLFHINTVTCPNITSAMEEHAFSKTTGLPEKFTEPASVDDYNDAMGYCPAYLYPIKKRSKTQSTELPL